MAYDTEMQRPSPGGSRFHGRDSCGVDEPQMLRG